MLKKTELKKLQNFLNLQDYKLVENLLVRTVGFLKKNDTNERTSTFKNTKCDIYGLPAPTK
jgi:hypothetical protein